MKKEERETWLRQEILKDNKDILNHKKNVIEEIKKVGLNTFLSNKKLIPEDSTKNKDGLWKKIKKVLKF
jgi:hypothetical protein